MSMYAKKMKYIVKSCSLDNPQNLQDLLNDMSEEGWELYSMQEDEDEEGKLFCHCIFMKQAENIADNSDVINISSFKSRMEKMLSSEQSPYDVCVDIQSKIKEQKNRIAKIKKELEVEAPSSAARKKLNDKISAGLKELEDLKVMLTQATSPDNMFSKLKEEKLSVNLSEELLNYMNSDAGNLEDELVAQTVKTRVKLAENLGYVLPKIVFKDDFTLSPYEFCIKLRDIKIFKGLVYPDYFMFFEDELNLDKKIKNSIKDIDAVTGRNIIWIERDKAKDFWCSGISGAEFIIRALEYCAIKYVDEIFDYLELEKYIDIVRNSNEFLAENLIPDYLPMSNIKSLLTNLIKEKVSIKNIVYIFEKLNDFASSNDKVEMLDKIRMALARQICNDYKNEEGIIEAFELTEDNIVKLAPLFNFNEEIEDEDIDEDIMIFDIDYIEKLAAKISKQIKKLGIIKPILVVPIEIRTILSSVLNKFIDITVLAKEETLYNAKVETIAKI